MNLPSHANSSVGQVADMYRGNPQALMQRTQPQNGVTPELIDLLAMQKLQAEKQAAASQMAMQQGQAQPTVAQGMEQQAMQSARQEIVQKLGLPGLANQGQNIPAGGAPAAQAPQGAPAMPRMAAGGIVALPSNLPAGYAGGGIVSFEEGGTITLPKGTPWDAVELVRMQNPDREVRVEGAGDFWKEVARGGDAATKQIHRAAAYNSDVENAKKGTAPAPTNTGGASGSWGEDTNSFGGASGSWDAPAPVESPAEPPVVPPAPGGGISVSAGRGSSTGARTPTPHQAVPMPDDGLRKLHREKLMEGMRADPEKSGLAAEADYQRMIGADRGKGLADLAKNQEAKTALHEQRQGQRGERFLGMDMRTLMGMAAAPRGGQWYETLGAGAQAAERGREADFTEDSAYLETMNKGITAMNAARDENNIGKYNAIKAATAAAMAQVTGSLGEANKLLDSEMDATVSMRNADLQAATSRENTRENAAARIQAAHSAAAARGDNKTAQIIQQAINSAQTYAKNTVDAMPDLKKMDMNTAVVMEQLIEAQLGKNEAFKAAMQTYTGAPYKPAASSRAGWNATIVPTK